MATRVNLHRFSLVYLLFPSLLSRTLLPGHDHPHETGTGELCPQLPDASFGSRTFTTDAVQHGVARRRRLLSAFFLHFSCDY